MSRAAAGNAEGIDGQKGRVEVTKVKRYRPGQVPEWMRSEDTDADQVPRFAKGTNVFETSTVSERRTAVYAPVIVKRSDDSRLARLAAATDAGQRRSIAAPQIVASKSRIHKPEQSEEESEEERIIEEARPATRHRERPPEEEEEEEEEENDEIIALRRAARRQQSDHLDQDEKEEDIHKSIPSVLPPSTTKIHSVVTIPLDTDVPIAPLFMKQHQEKEEQEESSSSEYSSDSDDSDEIGNHHNPLSKPIFVPRTNRETLIERVTLEQQAEEAYEKERLRLEERKKETKEIIAQRMADELAQEEAAAAGPRDVEEIDTDDDAADEVEEYSGWKLREYNRIARDKEEREKEVKEAEEKERWKAMSEEDKLAWLQQNKPKENQKERNDKKKWTFLQKYYHKGAFFQTEAEYKGEVAPLIGDILHTRDFSAPTGEDALNRSALPAVMQVRNFGKRSRSKWTHLKNEDTTDFNVPWQTDKKLKRKMEERMAGTEQVFTKPKNLKT